jgi:hypothetical protein
MTDAERVLELLLSLDIDVELCPYPEQLDAPGIDAHPAGQAIRLSTYGMRHVDGYCGFRTVFKFNTDGKFCEVLLLE